MLPGLGGALIIAGVAILLDSFARFALEGVGTPAPIYPTDRLIVTGFYRHVRNPMYLGVLAVIFDQALSLSDGRLIHLWLGRLARVSYFRGRSRRAGIAAPVRRAV